ncbi:YcbK family protein [Roseomonas sp. USHLN139]|uniref:YcbK family protein n=1 Tax=Roseomonas sp. USHLN139 TaxID=3081298 RepID=UPI003B012F2B
MRRRFFCTLSLAAAVAAPPALAAPRLLPDPPLARRLRLRHAASGAVFSGIYHNGLAADPKAMAELSQVLADTRTGQVRAFDVEAIDIVWEMGRRQGFAEFTVLSGYRTEATNREVNGAANSQHLRAAALDLQIARARFDGFAEAALKLGRGGVGLYPGQGFIHLDSGTVRHWREGETPAAMALRRGPVLPSLPPRSPAEQRIDRLAEAWANLRRR